MLPSLLRSAALCLAAVPLALPATAWAQAPIDRFGAADAFARAARTLEQAGNKCAALEGGASAAAVQADLRRACADLEIAQELLALPSPLRIHPAPWKPLSTAPATFLEEAAQHFSSSARHLREERDTALESTMESGFKAYEQARTHDALVTRDFEILAVLLAVLAGLFVLETHPRGRRIFKVVPLLLFAYFLPTLLSNTGIIPIDAALYTFIKRMLMPASLVLLVLAIDIPAIARLGRPALTLFLAGSAGIVLGGPLAYLACGWFLPPGLGADAWKSLAALSGSWIGGGVNFVAIGESVGASASSLSMIVVVDVAISNIWLAILLYFAGRERSIDARIGADRRALEEVRARVESFQREVARPTSLPDLFALLAIAFGLTALATALSRHLPELGGVIRSFTWVVLLVTSAALALSFTRLRNLEGAGASKLGSVLLYLLVACIGAQAQFAKLIAAPAMLAVGAVWISIHITIILAVRRLMRTPIFFSAVGSTANIGGAASAQIVAGAFHPALAPVGALLAVGGYVLGTYAGLACAFLLELTYRIVG